LLAHIERQRTPSGYIVAFPRDNSKIAVMADWQAPMPGAYDWERFEADDVSRKLRVIVSVLRGDPFDVEYLRKYAAYIARPTRCPPPLPEQYAKVRMAVYERDKLVERQDCGLDQAPGLADGIWRIQIENQGARTNLTFRPRWNHSPHCQKLLAGEGEHEWIVDGPLCDVEGEVRVAGRNHSFGGLGLHDRLCGKRPIALSLDRWTWGRILTPDRAVIFHQLYPTKCARQIHVVEADAVGIRRADSKDLSLVPEALSETVHTSQLK
jgi:hypothetical protein